MRNITSPSCFPPQLHLRDLNCKSWADCFPCSNIYTIMTLCSQSLFPRSISDQSAANTRPGIRRTSGQDHGGYPGIMSRWVLPYSSVVKSHHKFMLASYMMQIAKFLAILHHNASFYNFCIIINSFHCLIFSKYWRVIVVSVSHHSAAGCGWRARMAGAF